MTGLWDRGLLSAIAVTIAGDYYVGRERLRMQGALSAVWAGAAMVGPIVGGLLVAMYMPIFEMAGNIKAQ